MLIRFNDQTNCKLNWIFSLVGEMIVVGWCVGGIYVGVFCPTCVGGGGSEVFCLFYEAEAHRFDGRLGSVSHIKLLEDRFGVSLDGVDADAEGVTDGLVGHPFDQ